MRNNSKRYKHRHLPSREWKKVVRFNGRDYLMNTVYDKTSGLDFDDDELWNNEHSLSNDDYNDCGISVNELPWMNISTSSRRPINEDFFDDFGEELLQDEETNVVDKIANNGYPVMTVDGELFDVDMSEDSIKNAIFTLIYNFISVSNTDDFNSIDDILYVTGRMNDINSYKMAFDEIIYSYGSFKFVVRSASKKNSPQDGYLTIYFTNEHNAIFRIDYPEIISYHRPTRSIELNYEQLCNTINVKTNYILKKTVDEYYSQTLREVFDAYMSQGISLTLLRRKYDLNPSVFSQVKNPIADASFIKNNFSVVEKYSPKKPGDYSVLESCLNRCMQDIKMINNGSETNVRDDEFYILIGNRETYIKNLTESVWLDLKKRSNVFGASNFIPVRFYTSDPNLPVIKIEHNMILVPFTAFSSACPGLLLHIQ